MLEKFKDNLFYIAIFIFSITLFLEHLIFGETDITCFIKGFACGLELVGIIIIFMKKKGKKN